jgi:hypothetical protein
MTTDKTYWKALEKRYFEGVTTESEERLLRQFLTTKEAQSEDFEELRAVMGYLAMGKVEHKKKVIPLWRRPALVKWSAAACFVLLAGIGVYHLMPRTTYVAYIDGRRTTDKAEVLAQMHGVMADINADSPTSEMEASMSNLLNTLNTEE